MKGHLKKVVVTVVAALMVLGLGLGRFTGRIIG